VRLKASLDTGLNFNLLSRYIHTRLRAYPSQPAAYMGGSVRSSEAMFRPAFRIPFQLPGLSAASCMDVLFSSLPFLL